MAATKKKSGAKNIVPQIVVQKEETAKRINYKKKYNGKENTQTGRKSATGRRRSIEEINEYKDKLAFGWA